MKKAIKSAIVTVLLVAGIGLVVLAGDPPITRPEAGDVVPLGDPPITRPVE